MVVQLDSAAAAGWAPRWQITHGTCVDAQLVVGYMDPEDRLLFFGDTRAWVSHTWVDGIWDGMVWGLESISSSNQTKVSAPTFSGGACVASQSSAAN